MAGRQCWNRNKGCFPESQIASVYAGASDLFHQNAIGVNWNPLQRIAMLRNPAQTFVKSVLYASPADASWLPSKGLTCAVCRLICERFLGPFCTHLYSMTPGPNPFGFYNQARGAIARG